MTWTVALLPALPLVAICAMPAWAEQGAGAKQRAGPAPSEPSRPAIAAPEDASGVFERGVVEVQPSARPIEELTISNRLGSVRIEGHDSDTVIIHALKRAPDDDTLDRLKVSLLPDSNGVVRIETRVATGGELRPLRAGSVRIDLIIQAPRAAALQARVWNGALEVEGMDNGADLTANEGDISVDRTSGRIVTSSAQGRQRLTEIVGEVDARGLLGELAFDMVRGRRLEAVLHEGRIIAHRIRSRDVAIRVARGDIELHGIPALQGSWSVVTYRGNVQLQVSDRTAFLVRARARRGTVKLPDQLRAAREDGGGWISGQHGGTRHPANIEVAAAIGNIAVTF